MSRLFHRLRIRLAGFLHRSPPNDPDRVLVGLCRDLARTVSALQLMLSADGRDTDEIPGFDELADCEAALIMEIAALPARTLLGVVAKAEGALLRPEVQGFDGATTLALSAAENLVRLAAGSERPSSGDPALPAPIPFDHARAVLLSDPTELMEQIMNNLFEADRRPSVRGRDVARGVSIGVLGQLGAGSLVGGIALLAGRPDLPRPFPATLVVVGLTATALALSLLHRAVRP